MAQTTGAQATGARASLIVNGVDLEMIERSPAASAGKRPILFLHPNIGIDPDAAVLDELARHGRVLAPSHPGFGTSALPKGMTSVDDLAYFYLDLMDQLDLRETIIVGVGMGGWLAAEIAVKTTERISRLVLANPVGIKVSDRETRDIVDVWSLLPEQVDALAYFDAKAGHRDYAKLPPAVSLAAARNREASARFGWSPYMHNPKLKGRLHRIRVPTLLLWGTADRILSEPYGRAFCAAIPGASFETIQRAGHYPHIEQPAEFARRIGAFAGAKS